MGTPRSRRLSIVIGAYANQSAMAIIRGIEVNVGHKPKMHCV